MKLMIRALVKFLFGLLLVGVLLFLPAGGFAYRGAWLFIALLFIPMLLLGTVLLIKAPSLLEKRLSVRETENAQKGVIAASGLLFIASFITAGLDFRFGWSHVPTWAVIAASAVFLLAYALFAEVMRENAYLSRTVEVQKGQTVIDTGLYSIIRHPMYAVTLWLFLAIPVILGSWWSLLCILPYIGVIAVRIKNEEKVLEERLDGYLAYENRVKYRMIPFLW